MPSTSGRVPKNLLGLHEPNARPTQEGATSRAQRMEDGCPTKLILSLNSRSLEDGIEALPRVVPALVEGRAFWRHEDTVSLRRKPAKRLHLQRRKTGKVLMYVKLRVGQLKQ